MSKRPICTLDTAELCLLAWLKESDVNQYGECHGTALQTLVAKGLVEVMSEETETRNPFIAKGHGIMYRAVRVTKAGRKFRAVK